MASVGLYRAVIAAAAASESAHAETCSLRELAQKWSGAGRAATEARAKADVVAELWDGQRMRCQHSTTTAPGARLLPLSGLCLWSLGQAW